MDEIEQLLTRGVEKIYPSKEALEKVLRQGKKIRLYNGIDPTGPFLHLGHMVVLRKLRQFQDLGHHVILLIGDFTAMIGDPSGKSKARRPMTHEEVLVNAKTYKEQAGKILSFSGENPVEIKYNSEWLGKLGLADVMRLASLVTYPQIIERDMFQKRMKEGQDVFVNELFYPLMQGYDSVFMDVDLEIGGTDQTFNMLMGRTLMKKIKGKEKFILTTKLLVDSKGEKVGKTAGNALFLNATPADMYGGIMSFPDEVISLAFELLTTVSLELVGEHRKALEGGKVNPMDLKKQLALEVVKLYHGEKSAKAAQEEFERVFQKGETPLYDISIYRIQAGKRNIVDLLVETKLVKSRSEAKRLVGQKAVEIDGVEVSSIMNNVSIKDGMIIRVGKRKFVKIKAS